MIKIVKINKMLGSMIVDYRMVINSIVDTSSS